jgi:hypothetical protein
MIFSIRACLSLTALCFLAGLGLVIATFAVSPESASALRPLVLQWHGALIGIVGAGCVVIHHATTRDITPRQAEAQAIAHCPQALKRTSYGFMLVGVVTFFTAIGLVESGRVARSVGESAILGAFSILMSAGVFARLWSTLERLRRGDG